MEPNPYTTPPRQSRQTLIVAENEQPEAPALALKASEVARKIKSFDHFLFVWGTKAGYYLPQKNCLTWHYVAQVLAGEKRLLRVDQVGHVQELPKARGVLVNELWEHCKSINELHCYFPDVTPRSQIPRTYFYNVKIIRC